MRDYELDHIVPLNLGGAPLNRRNFQLPPWRGACNARMKDELEAELSRAVCEGDVSLIDAQREIVKDWKASYRDWINPNGCGGQP
jgi:hypothetical protein